ncbi:hypothetical protein [Plantactinospora mayteni]|nr:hypothetical protein [Plantactinospora mayteni]
MTVLGLTVLGVTVLGRAGKLSRSVRAPSPFRLERYGRGGWTTGPRIRP